MNTLVLVVSLVLVGCSATIVDRFDGDTDTITSSKSTKLSYEITVNGCPTGKHEFSSKGAYCDGLLNDSLNNHCARFARERLYKSNCGELPLVAFAVGNTAEANENGGELVSVADLVRPNRTEVPNDDGSVFYQLDLNLTNVSMDNPPDFGAVSTPYSTNVRLSGVHSEGCEYRSRVSLRRGSAGRSVLTFNAFETVEQRRSGSNCKRFMQRAANGGLRIQFLDGEENDRYTLIDLTVR